MGEAGIPTDVISGHGAVLRLYAALNPFQRSRLETTGVPTGELNGLQVELLHTWKQAAGDTEWIRMRREPGRERLPSTHLQNEGSWGLGWTTAGGDRTRLTAT